MKTEIEFMDIGIVVLFFAFCDALASNPVGCALIMFVVLWQVAEWLWWWIWLPPPLPPLTDNDWITVGI